MKQHNVTPRVFACLFAPTQQHLKRRQFYYLEWRDLSIICGRWTPFVEYCYSWHVALEVCASKHRMNGTTYCILITACCLFGRGYVEWCHLSCKTCGWGFTKHIFAYREYAVHIFDAFSYLLGIFIYIFFLSVSKLASVLWAQEAMSSWHRCQKVLSGYNVELPVGINLNFFKRTRWKSINKLASWWKLDCLKVLSIGRLL